MSCCHPAPRRPSDGSHQLSPHCCWCHEGATVLAALRGANGAPLQQQQQRLPGDDGSTAESNSQPRRACRGDARGTRVCPCHQQPRNRPFPRGWLLIYVREKKKKNNKTARSECTDLFFHEEDVLPGSVLPVLRQAVMLSWPEATSRGRRLALCPAAGGGCQPTGHPAGASGFLLLSSGG